MAKIGVFLNDNGKAIYKRLSDHCEQNNVLFSIDDIMISNLAFWLMVQWECSEEYGTEAGFIQKTKSGYGQVSPKYAMMVKAQEMVAKLSPPFGITPGDRAKIFSGMKKEKKKGFNLKSK